MGCQLLGAAVPHLVGVVVHARFCGEAPVAYWTAKGFFLRLRQPVLVVLKVLLQVGELGEGLGTTLRRALVRALTCNRKWKGRLMAMIGY